MCEHPIIAYARRYHPIDSKIFVDNDWLTNPYNKLLFTKPKPKEAHLYYKLQLNCGWCLECRLRKSREWSTRCYLENKMHSESCFVTLTYNDKHLPYKDGVPSLCIKDIQNFFKRLKKKFPDKNILRFWAGEYGEKRGRPHYHAIIFGYKPQDLVAERNKSNRGYTTYRSKELQKIWGNGYVNIGTVTAESAGYVARYTMKKAGVKPQKRIKKDWKPNPKYDEWCRQRHPEEWKKCPYNKWIKPYQWGREPERCNSSKRPAIGLTYWLQNKEELKRIQQVYVYANQKTETRALPHYFVEQWKKENWEEAYNYQYKKSIEFEKIHLEELKQTHQTEEEWRKRKSEELAKRTKKLQRPTDFTNDEDILSTATTATLNGSVSMDKIPKNQLLILKINEILKKYY